MSAKNKMGTLKRSLAEEDSVSDVKKKKQRKDDAEVGKKKKPVKYEKTTRGQTPSLKVNLTSNNKPNWEEYKKKNKELKTKRKEQKCSSYANTKKAKSIWEKLRREDCDPKLRVELTNELFLLLKGHLQKVVFTHDMARVVQWLLKLGEPSIRSAIIDELKPILVNMIQAKYSNVCVKRMLKYGGNASRQVVIQSLLGHVVKLLSHSVAAPILELAYSNWATSSQKNSMKQEFYGDMYKQSKETDVQCLADVFSKSASMKGSILAATKSNLVRVLNKGLVSSSLVMSVLSDLLNHSSSEDRDELLSLVRSHCLNLVDSKEGIRIAMMCCWYATPKERKKCVKSLKGHVRKLAMSEHGHLFLLALFDTVDDTVLLKKVVISELLPNIAEVALDEFGRKVVLYLVAHRDPLYFHPALIDVLKQGDASDTVKKDMNIRESELRGSIIDALLKSVTLEPKQWLSSSACAMVALGVLRAGQNDVLEEAFLAVAKHICDVNSKVQENDVEYPVVEHSGIHFMLKKLIQHDKENSKNSQVSFSSVLVQELSTSVLQRWVKCNRACFLLICVMESAIPSVEEMLKTKMKDKLLNALQNQSSVGSKILYKKLKS